MHDPAGPGVNMGVHDAAVGFPNFNGIDDVSVFVVKLGIQHRAGNARECGRASPGEIMAGAKSSVRPWLTGED